MEAASIKPGDILEVTKVVPTSSGWVYGDGLIVPGTKVKVIKERGKNTALFDCHVYPEDANNGPVQAFIFASQLRPITNPFFKRS